MNWPTVVQLSLNCDYVPLEVDTSSLGGSRHRLEGTST